MRVRRLVGALVALAGCHGGGLAEGVYQATFHDRVGECPEYRGVRAGSPLPLLLTRGDPSHVTLSARDMELEGVEDGDTLELTDAEDAPWDSGACAEGEWSYRAVLSAAIGESFALAGTVQVSALSTCETAEGETFEYPYEEEWQFEARYVGTVEEGRAWGHGLWEILDPGYCP